MATSRKMASFATIDDYITNQPIEAQNLLNALRSIIKEAVPDVAEVCNSKVPAFTLVCGSKNVPDIMIAAYSGFVSFYPFPATIAAFAEALKGYKTGKGSVQFPFGQPLPKDLIMNMIKFRKEELLKTLSKKNEKH